jgi:hypothetical protein
MRSQGCSGQKLDDAASVDIVFLLGGVVVELSVLPGLGSLLRVKTAPTLQGRATASTHVASPLEGVVLKIVFSCVLPKAGSCTSSRLARGGVA